MNLFTVAILGKETSVVVKFGVSLHNSPKRQQEAVYVFKSTEDDEVKAWKMESYWKRLLKLTEIGDWILQTRPERRGATKVYLVSSQVHDGEKSDTVHMLEMFR
jgi:hypothetical protein